MGGVVPTIILSGFYHNKYHSILNFSLTVHGLNKKWQCFSGVLAVNHFPGEHNSIRIAEKIRNLIQTWEINEEKVHTFVTDSASNMLKVLFLNFDFQK